MGGTVKRGALIVLEGLDKSGKSTQCVKLCEHLRINNCPVKKIQFPARESRIGKVINSYLTNKQELADEVIHLLFTANRWELQNEMQSLLESGTTLVVDRYSYSGVAYSVAKGLPFDWCMSPEQRLIQPDKVFYLHTPVELLAERLSYGDERYEKLEFQRKVAEVFDSMCEKQQPLWQKINANMPIDDISTLILQQTLELIQDVQEKPLNLIK